SLDLSAVPNEVRKIVDLKAPGSGEVERNLWANLELLQPHDEIKVVIADRRDYEWAREQVTSRGLTERHTVLFSPVFGKIEPVELVGWILEDALDVRFQLQMHKFI